LIPHTMTSMLQFAFLDLFRLPIRSGRTIALAAQTVASTGGMVARRDYQTVVKQNQQLQNHIDTIEATLLQQQQQIGQLAGFRQVKAWERMAFLPADAVTRTDPQHLLINRGTVDDLTKGHLVLADNAIIGTITGLGTHTAKVELVTSGTYKLPVSVQPSNVQGILCGRGDGFMEIRVRPPCPAKVGETVYAQKIPGLLDAPMVVGTVVQCGVDDQEPVLWEIRVQPKCDLDHIGMVWVIVSGSP